MTPFQLPASTPPFGFVLTGLGAHSSRTIMLAELRQLLATCPPTASYPDYGAAILDHNVLHKRTQTTRRKSLHYLRELYDLRPETLLFRALRDLWYQDEAAQPMLALLCALARDPSFRASARVILNTPVGAEVTGQMLTNEVEPHYRGRLNANTLAKIGRNAASSWTQSGHLMGRTHKLKATPAAGPAATAYALLLGYLCGARGEALFATAWAAITELPDPQLHEQAFAASRLGWLEYRHAGAITDVQFAYLLREEGHGRE